jgi:uncharacterized protein
MRKTFGGEAGSSATLAQLPANIRNVYQASVRVSIRPDETARVEARPGGVCADTWSSRTGDQHRSAEHLAVSRHPAYQSGTSNGQAIAAGKTRFVGRHVKRITIRVYGPLNDFVPSERRHVAWPYAFEGGASAKDVIEGSGVPHPEIDLILVNGESVTFDYAVQDADRIAVFPRFETIDVSAVTRVRRQRPDPIRFVLDSHLGKLARHLRLAGFDAVYRRDAHDDELAEIACRERRILLTRDRGLLKRRVVVHGYFIRQTATYRQFVEVLARFSPLPLAPFSRCLRCNAGLREVLKSAVEARLGERTRRAFAQFHECSGCGRVYWRGSHWAELARILDAAVRQAEVPPTMTSQSVANRVPRE